MATIASTTRITDFTPFFSIISKLRKPSPIRALMPIMNLPGMISLAGGLPNSQTFPFQSIKVELNNQSTTSTTSSLLEIQGKELSDGLQYHPSQGLPSLVQYMRNHQQQTHHLPPFNATGNNSTSNGSNSSGSSMEWDVICTSGSQDGLTKAFEMFLNPYNVQLQGFNLSTTTNQTEGSVGGEEQQMDSIRDAIIIERPTYSGSLSTLYTLNPLMIEVDVDANGIIPEQLEESIIEFKKMHPKSMIKFLYTIPNGQNPSGCSQTLERKQQIYSLSQKYNFLILEDDPYYYLSLYDENDKEMSSKIERVPSYLSMDTDDRVLRFDSFSKILSSGIRLGFVTGPIKLINQIVLHIQSSNLHSCGLSQTIVCNLLNQWAGMNGFLNHIEMIQKFYTSKRNDLIDSINTHLLSVSELADQVEFNIPVCGMFVWMKLKGVPDTLKFIEQKARKENVLLLPGTYFYPTPNSKTNYVRAAFSTASKEQMDEACKRLAILLKQELIEQQQQLREK